MDWRHYVRSRLPRLAVSAEREIEIVDELALQLEAIYERALGAGATAAEARLRAQAEVPDWAALARTLGTIKRPDAPAPVPGAQVGGVMTGFIQDIRYALRALARAPGFAVVSIVTLALGIGATTIVYSLVDGVLLRPLPIHQPDRVVQAREINGGREGTIAWLNFVDWKSRATSYQQLAAWRGVTSSTLAARAPSSPRMATTATRPPSSRASAVSRTPARVSR